MDIDAETLCLDPAKAENALRKDTKAVLAVHLYGLPAEMIALREMADKRNLKVIEDAAQAHGAEVDGRRAGSLGDAGCFSFFPSKNLGAVGDAGAVVTADEELAHRIRRVSNHGRTEKYLHGEIGGNDRLDALQAAVLKVKLEHLEQWTEERRQVARWYREALDGLPLTLPSEPEGRRSVYYLYAVRTPKRDRLREASAGKASRRGCTTPSRCTFSPRWRTREDGEATSRYPSERPMRYCRCRCIRNWNGNRFASLPRRSPRP